MHMKTHRHGSEPNKLTPERTFTGDVRISSYFPTRNTEPAARCDGILRPGRTNAVEDQSPGAGADRDKRRRLGAVRRRAYRRDLRGRHDLVFS